LQQLELGIHTQTDNKVNELDIKLNKTLQRVDHVLSERLNTTVDRLNSTDARLVLAVNELDIKLNLTLQRVDRDINERLNKIDARLNEFQASLSPFIKIGNQIRLLRAQGFFGRTKVIIKKILRALIGRLIKISASFPRTKRSMIYLSKKIGIYDRIQSSRRPPQSTHSSYNSLNVIDLEPHALNVLNEINTEDNSSNEFAATHVNQASHEQLHEVLQDLPIEVRLAFKELNAEIKKQEKH
jgi:hypothetical protein